MATAAGYTEGRPGETRARGSRLLESGGRVPSRRGRVSLTIAPCSHRPPCPGCPRYGEEAPNGRALARLSALADELGGPAPEWCAGEAGAHRHRARLMVRGRPRSPKIGLFQAGSHRIVDTPHCRVHHPRINEVAAVAKRAIRASDSAPYADLPHTGLVRALQVVVERESQSAQVVVVANDAESASSEPLLEALLREAGDSLHSLWWNGNPERSNVILGSTWRRVTSRPVT